MSYAVAHARLPILASALMLAACAAPMPKPAIAPPAPPPLDASYDWHTLLIAPFGSVLKDVPLTLHEVLVFRDEAHSASPADDPECYALNGTAPRFIARTPSEYLLCFKHDRLSRVEATVRLPRDESAHIFAEACGLWMKNAQVPNAAGCEGADGGVAFNARLENETEDADTQLTIQLDASDPASEHAPDPATQHAPDR
jgi:hypothetical protein